MVKGADIEEALSDERDEAVAELETIEAMVPMYEAASIACHRVAQCGWDSQEARDAHQQWARLWLEWSKSREAAASTPNGAKAGLRFTGDFLPLGRAEEREVVAYRVFDEGRDTPVIVGVAFRNEATALIREQLRLLAIATTGAEAYTVDLNASRKDTPS